MQSSPGEPFTSAAVAAAKHLVFEPVIQDGGAVGLVLAYRYRFEPPSPSIQDAGVSPARLSGRVMTKGTRDVVALAQITLADGGQPSAETDAQGRFTLEVPPGALRVEVTASGHTKRVFNEQLSAGQRLEVLYRLEPTFVRPYETVVRGQTDRAELSRVTLTGPELHEAAGTGGQPLRVVMLLPGVVTPAYARLDLRVSKTITFSTFSAELYLDILNTLGIPEVYGYRYQGSSGPIGAASEPLPREAFSLPIVLPTLGVKVVY